VTGGIAETRRYAARPSIWPAISQFTAQLGEQVKALTNAANRMQRAIRVLAVGLDYRRYARFEMLLPQVSYFMNGQGSSRFVIETALHLAEMDFDLDLRKLWQEHQALQRAGPRPSVQASGGQVHSRYIAGLPEINRRIGLRDRPLAQPPRQ
jgi:hypothetical protein